MTSRRGFLRALVGAAIAPVVAKAAPLLPAAAPGSDAWYAATQSESYVSYTFRRAPCFFDIVVYTGDGERKQLPRAQFEATLIIVKCQTRMGHWYVLESDELPPELNLPGEQYIAYEFGDELERQAREIIGDNPHFIRVGAPA